MRLVGTGDDQIQDLQWRRHDDLVKLEHYQGGKPGLISNLIKFFSIFSLSLDSDSDIMKEGEEIECFSSDSIRNDYLLAC